MVTLAAMQRCRHAQVIAVLRLVGATDKL